MDSLKGYNEQFSVQLFLARSSYNNAAQSIPVPTKECKKWEKHPTWRRSLWARLSSVS
jgi:hypothetical protein